VHDASAAIATVDEDAIMEPACGEVRARRGRDGAPVAVLVRVVPALRGELGPCLGGAVVDPQVIVAVALVNAAKNEEVVVVER
jgi:hypothetical protein